MLSFANVCTNCFQTNYNFLLTQINGKWLNNTNFLNKIYLMTIQDRVHMNLNKLADKGIIAVNETVEDLWNSKFVSQLIEIDDIREVVE